MFGTLQSLHTFFNGTKRHTVLEHGRHRNPNIPSRSEQQYLSDTRWDSGFSALEAFQCLNPAILEALQTLSIKIINPGMDGTTLSDANGLLSDIGTFDLILSIEVATMILGVTQPYKLNKLNAHTVDSA